MVTNWMLSSFHIPLIFEILNLFGRKGLCLLISTTGFDKRKAVSWCKIPKLYNYRAKDNLPFCKHSSPGQNSNTKYLFRSVCLAETIWRQQSEEVAGGMGSSGHTNLAGAGICGYPRLHHQQNLCLHRGTTQEGRVMARASQEVGHDDGGASVHPHHHQAHW